LPFWRQQEGNEAIASKTPQKKEQWMEIFDPDGSFRKAGFGEKIFSLLLLKQ
jgi:hypothetical protein